MSDMPDHEDDLRATEEAIISDAQRVQRLETEKAALDPADPRVDQLSAEVERVVEGLGDKAAIERQLSEEIDAR